MIINVPYVLRNRYTTNVLLNSRILKIIYFDYVFRICNSFIFSIKIHTERSAKDASSAPLFKLDLGKPEDEVKVDDKVKDESKKNELSPCTARSETSEIKTETAAPDTVRSETDASRALDSVHSDTSKAEERPAPDSARSDKSVVSVVTEEGTVYVHVMLCIYYLVRFSKATLHFTLSGKWHR